MIWLSQVCVLVSKGQIPNMQLSEEESKTKNFYLFIFLKQPKPQLDLSAPLCESALSSNMLSLFLPQDLCTRSAFCQEHFFLSSPEGCFFPPLNSGLSLNTTFTERLFLAMISVIDPSSHSLSHHPYFLKLSRS